MKTTRRLLTLAILALASAAPACAAPADGEAEDGEVEASTAAALANRSDYDQWSPVVTAAGAKLHPERMVTVLGIRGLSTDGTRHQATTAHRYDDTFVVLLPSKKAFVLAGSTHPFEKDVTAGPPDVDGNGKLDVGRIRPGQYLALGRGTKKDALVGGMPGYNVVTYPDKSGKLPGIRDTNQDGVYDGAEDVSSHDRGDTITEVLFHHGDEGAPTVIGCQVMSQDSMTALVKAVGAGATFHYVLVDAPENPVR